MKAFIFGLLLLAPVNVAADCRWVMRNFSYDTYEKTSKNLFVRGFETQDACERAVPAQVEEEKKFWEGVFTKINKRDNTVRLEGTRENPLAVRNVTLSCEPAKSR